MRVGPKGAVVVAALAGASVFAFTVPAAHADPLVQGNACEIEDDCPPPALIGDLSIEKHVDGGTTPTPGFDLVVDPIPGDATVSDGQGNDSGVFPSTDEATSLRLSGYAQNNGITPDLDVFIGEVLRDGFVFDGVSCGDGSFVVSGYEFRTIDADQVGQVFRLLPLQGESAPQCAVENLSATIDLTKTVSPASVAPGASVVFTITATNTGDSTLYDGVLEDVLPSGMTFVSAVGGTGVTCDATAPVRCDLDAVAPGGVRTATVTANVAAGVADASTLTNAASVEALAPRWTPDLCVFDQSEVLTFALSAVDQLIEGEECDAPAFVVSDEAAATVTAVVPTTSTTTTTTTTAAPTTTALGVQPPAPTTLPPLTGILPETGAGDGNLAIIAMSTVVLGGLLLLVRRRRPGQA
ncbi:MAG TPA: DUF11 domain-containing protein [Ilumatobacteraceae bacterium]|nr:DUF11 domain-containing protein [Ilumatobacteraceae bacterium]